MRHDGACLGRRRVAQTAAAASTTRECRRSVAAPELALGGVQAANRPAGPLQCLGHRPGSWRRQASPTRLDSPGAGGCAKKGGLSKASDCCRCRSRGPATGWMAGGTLEVRVVAPKSSGR